MYRLNSYSGKTPFIVYVIRTLKDNYSYIVVEKENQLGIFSQSKRLEVFYTGLAIDVGEVKPVLEVISSQRLNINAVATTHHHM